MEEGVERPRLRALEAFPVEQDGGRLIGLRDPGGFTDQIALLPIPLLDLVSLFDGEHTVAEMCDILARRRGDEAPGPEDIAKVVERFDEAGFLDSPGFALRKGRIEGDWLARSSRPAAHAGGAYAGEVDALRSQIDGFFTHREGPGALPPHDGAPKTRLTGLIAPHIDFHRGGPTYGWAYRALLERADADLFVILGTCHAGMAEPFAATLKPYETPLGAAAVDRDFFEALQRRYGHDLLASETAHRAEHSVEFQAVMLRRLLSERPFSILPVLASFLHEAIWGEGKPESDPRVPRFLDALRRDAAGDGAQGLRHRRCGPGARGPALRRRRAEHARLPRAGGGRGSAHAGGGDGGTSGRLLRLGGRRRRPPAHLRALADLRVPARAAPYAVVRFEPEGDGFAVTLNDLTRERLDPETLRLGAGEVPYCRVKGGAFDARFSRAAAYQLLERVEPDASTGRGALRVGGRRYALGS